MPETKILALTGKGGVGKTTLSAAFVRVLGEKYPDSKILAIDADPAIGLAIALGMKVNKTVDDLRREVVDAAKDDSGSTAIELLGETRFRIFDALAEKGNTAFLAIGRPEGAGCYCSVNAYLKEVIDMVSRDFDYVVIDGEAGIEQINRRVMEKVTHLFLISDASFKGVQVAKSILKVADELVAYEQCGIIFNRVDNVDAGSILKDNDLDAELLAVISGDSELMKNDMCGKSIYEISEDAPVLNGARKALEKMLTV